MISLEKKTRITPISYLEKWSLQEFTSGIDTKSAAGRRILVKALNEVEGPKASEDTLRYLEAQGVKIGRIIHESKDALKLQSNGMDYGFLHLDGKDKKGDIVIELTVFGMRNKMLNGS